MYFNNADNDYNWHQSASNDLLYLLGIHTLILCANPKKVLRFINFLNKHYRSDTPQNCTTQYAYFIQINKAAAFFELGCRKSVEDIYGSLSFYYQNKQEVLTPFMKILYHGLRIKTLLDTPQQLLVINEIKNVRALAKHWGYRYLKIKSFAILLNNESLKQEFPEFYRQINYEASKLSREHRLDLNIFMRGQSLVLNKTL